MATPGTYHHRSFNYTLMQYGYRKSIISRRNGDTDKKQLSLNDNKKREENERKITFHIREKIVKNKFWNCETKKKKKIDIFSVAVVCYLMIA